MSEQRFSNVVISALEHIDAPVVVTSDEIDAQLEPVFDRLKFRPGLLESLAGVRERRFWEPGLTPADVSAMAGQKVLENSPVDREEIGVLINTSVWREYVEPATASMVHNRLRLNRNALNFDVVNACLGFLNGMAIVATMIESGQINHGMVVDGEGSRDVIERTIERLLGPDATPASARDQFATLTLGSGGAAVVLSRADLVDGGHPFLGGVSRAATEHSELCVASPDHMTTDVRGLLTSSLDIAKELWLAGQSGEYFNDEAVSLYAVHQVSEVHTRRVGDVLGVDQAKVPRIFPTFGNTGPSSIPMVLSKEVEAGNVKQGDRISLLGFGSGLNAAAYEVIW